MCEGDGTAAKPSKGQCVRVDGLEEYRGCQKFLYSLCGKVLATRHRNDVDECFVTRHYRHMGLDWSDALVRYTVPKEGRYALYAAIIWERWIPATQCTVIHLPPAVLPTGRWYEGHRPPPGAPIHSTLPIGDHVDVGGGSGAADAMSEAVVGAVAKGEGEVTAMVEFQAEAEWKAVEAVVCYLDWAEAEAQKKAAEQREPRSGK